MTILTQTQRKSSPVFQKILNAVARLNASERETLETLMDTEFAATLLARRKEIARLRASGGILSLDAIKQKFLA